MASTVSTPANSAPVITVDGPSGSGKGTLASLLADQLGWHLLDSGALYRIVAVMADRAGLALQADQEGAIAQLARQLEIDFQRDAVTARQRVDGETGEVVELTDVIRSEDAGEMASRVAVMQTVRDSIFDLQRRAKRPPGLVADGRDMGTYIFPHAELKIFLDASAEERAERRYKQLKNKGLSVSLRGLLEQIKERDARDRGRTIAPLKPAEDALIIDSTSMSIEAVFDLVMAEVAKRQLA